MNPEIPPSPKGPPSNEQLAQAEILDGREAKDLISSARLFQFSGGEIMAGTDKGIDYKNCNEDRVVISPRDGFVAVVDGMGGEGDGELAAQILAEELLALPSDAKSVKYEAQLKMNRKNIETGGAVFISAQFSQDENGKFLNIVQAGDAKLIVVSGDGTVSFESEDDSLVADLTKWGDITSDEALFDNRRHVVTNAISPSEEKDPKSYPRVRVQTKDLILLYSDGISDNFTSEEIAKKVKEGLSRDELFAWLSDATGERMKNYYKIIGKEAGERQRVIKAREKRGVFSDGFKSKPKKDNRALVIMEVK